MNYMFLNLALLLLVVVINPSHSDAADNTYKSVHGFSIDYPQGWHMETYMEIYKTLGEAERTGGNFFRITSYPENDASGQSPNIFSRDQMRVEGWIYPGYNGTLAELITGTRNVTRLENFKIDGNKAKKVWRLSDNPGALGDQHVLSIYYVDKKKKVIFTCYPTYSTLLNECYKIAGSFRFD